MRNPAKSGFVLPIVLVTTLIVAIIAGSVLSYTIYATRIAGIYTTKSQCRLSAQTALDETKQQIKNQFQRYYTAYPSSWNVLAWFNQYSAQSIGSGSYSCPMMQNQPLNDCNVSVTIQSVEKSDASSLFQYAHLTLRATASATSPAGIAVSKTIEETVEYALRRSSVFDYAYFVNNYGWFQGGGCTANGDIRANGNMSLDTKSYLNGFAFAAPNDAIGAPGLINISGGSTTRYMNRNDYWSLSGTQTRPTNPTSDSTGKPHAMGYEARSGLYSYQENLEMPFLGDLEWYRDVARNQNGTITQQGKTLVDGCYSATGPSGINNGADQGSLILDGTKHPIILSGPVVVDGDVIIKGTVKGQGAIYAGRNIHIVGDLTYDNPPAWPKPDNNPDQTIKKNQTKDMVGLIAKGNIVLGNYTPSSWLSGVQNYIRPPFVKPYECDPTDASIGYDAVFDGNYTAKDGGEKIEYVYNNQTKKYEPSKIADRKYYES